MSHSLPNGHSIPLIVKLPSTKSLRAIPLLSSPFKTKTSILLESCWSFNLQWQVLWGRSYTCCLVTKLYPTLCNPNGLQQPGLPVPHHLPEFAQVHVHWIGDAIQPSHPLLPSSPSAFNLSQNQGLYLFTSGGQSFGASASVIQWVFKVDFF